MHKKTIVLLMEIVCRPVVAQRLRGLLRQRQGVYVFACLVGICLLFTLGGCAWGGSDTSPTEQPVPDPTVSPTPTSVPTLPLATAQALSTAQAATATDVAIAAATATVVQATREAPARATNIARAYATGTVVAREEAAQQTAIAPQAVQATQTAFAAKVGPDATVVPPGDWGGDGIAVSVYTYSVSLHFDCASGYAFVPMTIDQEGAFRLPGVFTSCFPSCGPESSHPVYYQGHVYGREMTLGISGSADGSLTTTEPLEALYGQPADLQEPCPVCLAGNTLIDTPNGLVAVKDMREGMAVWTGLGGDSASDARQAATVLKTSRTKVPAGHEMVRLVLADGRELLVSPGHPTADGRLLGALSSGDRIDGTQVLSAELVPYKEDFTYDILPSGGTGTYWANGILIGSTLARPANGP